jgi:prepilin peptidase CpaA
VGPLVNALAEIAAEWERFGALAIPLSLSLWMAWEDLKFQRIPNYLTCGTALAGLAFQVACHGWPGLAQGLKGLALGFGLLIIPHLLGFMGGGDVKALAALGAWLGPMSTFLLFCYMSLGGGLMALTVLWWQGRLRATCRRLWLLLLNAVLCRSLRVEIEPAPPHGPRGFPYGVAMAMGMAGLAILG